MSGFFRTFFMIYLAVWASAWQARGEEWLGQGGEGIERLYMLIECRTETGNEWTTTQWGEVYMDLAAKQLVAKTYQQEAPPKPEDQTEKEESIHHRQRVVLSHPEQRVRYDFFSADRPRQSLSPLFWIVVEPFDDKKVSEGQTKEVGAIAIPNTENEAGQDEEDNPPQYEYLKQWQFSMIQDYARKRVQYRVRDIQLNPAMSADKFILQVPGGYQKKNTSQLLQPPLGIQ